MKRYFFAVIAAASILGLAGPAAASTLSLDLRPATPGGSQQIYQLTNGNYLGLWGISGGASALVNDPFTSSELLEDFGTNSSNIVGFYYSTPFAPGAWVGNPAEFTPFGTTVEISAVSSSSGTGRLWDSFWVEWSGGNLFNLAGNSNMPASANLIGDPLAPVPVPAAVWLFGTALLGLVAIARRKGA